MTAPKVRGIEKLLTELREQQDPSLVYAGIDEQGEPWLLFDPSDLSDSQREKFAELFVTTAAGLLGGSLGGVVH
jgi:hypothetical protein